jgi:Xaa-Pro aminopeptidase
VVTSIAISPEEHRARCDALLERVRSEDVSGVVLFDPYYVLYYAGFAFAPTERPIAFVLNADGQRALVVPRLEVEHAEAKSSSTASSTTSSTRASRDRKRRSRRRSPIWAWPGRSAPIRTATPGFSGIGARRSRSCPARG